MINTVIFDMDGVIFDTERLAHRCWLEVARQNGIKDMDKIYRPSSVATAAVLRKLY